MLNIFHNAVLRNSTSEVCFKDEDMHALKLHNLFPFHFHNRILYLQLFVPYKLHSNHLVYQNIVSSLFCVSTM